eukprot:CAMPEP_0171922314 /NCGR_PEP_ID=MMETSP0993-20121228/20969_1 /TAXON_ID=483369 /ORGANISM="non described non described, Strain CCMP2098" /LENGTH=125 /DNA_ID=CAMNT_0012559927 /DNA_START=107 /DNA_END=484 /DNA_ORIENTATION=+
MSENESPFISVAKTEKTKSALKVMSCSLEKLKVREVSSAVGNGDGVWVAAGASVGAGVGAGQMAPSVAVQVSTEALHAVAPQHEKGVPTSQAVHAEASLRSEGPEHPEQPREPEPGSNESAEQRL